MTSPLAKDVFVMLSFHAKMHKMLDYAHTYTEHERERSESIAQAAIQERIAQNMHTAIEKIEKKQLANNTEQLVSLKDLVHELQAEFEELKKK